MRPLIGPGCVLHQSTFRERSVVFAVCLQFCLKGKSLLLAFTDIVLCKLETQPQRDLWAWVPAGTSPRGQGTKVQIQGPSLDLAQVQRPIQATECIPSSEEHHAGKASARSWDRGWFWKGTGHRRVQPAAKSQRSHSSQIAAEEGARSLSETSSHLSIQRPEGAH